MKNHSKILSPRDSQIRIVQSNSAAYAASGFSNVYSSAKSKFKLAMESVSQACSSAMRFILPLAESNCQINDSPQVSTRLQPISDFILMKSDKPVQLDQGTSAPTPGRFETFEDSDRKKEAFFNSSKFRDPHQINMSYVRKPAYVSKKEVPHKIVRRENGDSERKDGIIEMSSRNSLNSGGVDTRSDRKNSDLVSEPGGSQTNIFRKEVNPEKLDKPTLNSIKEEKTINIDKKISPNSTIPDPQPSKSQIEEQKLSEAKNKDIKVTLHRKTDLTNQDPELESNSRKIISQSTSKFSIETKQESPIKPKPNASQGKKPSNETPLEEQSKSSPNKNPPDQLQPPKANPFASFASLPSTANPFANKKPVSESAPSIDEQKKFPISEDKPLDQSEPSKPSENLTQIQEESKLKEINSPDVSNQAIKPIDTDDSKLKTFLNPSIPEPNAGLPNPETKQTMNEVQPVSMINPIKPAEEAKIEMSSNQLSGPSNPFIHSSSQEIVKPRFVFGSGSISTSTQPAPALPQTANPFAAPAAGSFPPSSVVSNPFTQSSQLSNPSQVINPGQVNPFAVAVQNPSVVASNPFSQSVVIPASPLTSSMPPAGTQANPFSTSSNSFGNISNPFSQPVPSNSSSTATFPYSAGTANTFPGAPSNPFATGPAGTSTSQGNLYNPTSSISSSGHFNSNPYIAGTSSLANPSQTNFDSTRSVNNPFSQPVPASGNPFAATGNSSGYSGLPNSAGFGSHAGSSYSAGYANNSNPFNRDVQMNGGTSSGLTNQFQSSGSLTQGFGNSANGFGSANVGNPGINPRPELFQGSYPGNKEFSIGIMTNRNTGRGPRTLK